MYCKDFIYDGVRLSDYNCMIGQLDGGGIDTVSIGSVLTLTTVRTANTYRFRYVTAKYDTAYSCTFQIFKVDCANIDNYKFTEQDVAQIMRWLNRKGFYEFRKIDDDEEVTDIYYMATFPTINKIVDGDDVIGFELTMETNAPFAYYDGVTETHTFEGGEEWTVTDRSDEIGYLYPRVSITLNENADVLTLQNAGHNATTIKNCSSGETITFAGDTKQITTDNASHTTLYQDFNWQYPVLANEMGDRANVFTCNALCTVTITYSPICKAVL